MARRWYLLRHGQTNANLLNVIQGGGQRLDLPLNDEGVRQTEFTAQALARAPLDCIFMSPSIRTKQTAQEILKRRKPPVSSVILPDLLEINFGVLEGKKFEEAEKLYPDLMKEYIMTPSSCIFPNGEKVANVIPRVNKAVNYMLTTDKENILIVSHGGILALIFVYLFDLDIDKMFHAIRHETCGLSIVALEGSAWRKSTNRPQIIRMNDVSHLLR